MDHRILEVVLRGGQKKELLVRASELVVRTTKLIEKLANAGYLWPERQKHRRRLIEALSVQNPNRNVSILLGKGPDDSRVMRDDEPLPSSLSPALSDDDLVLKFTQRVAGARFFTAEMMKTATAALLRSCAAGFRKKDSEGHVRVYLLPERIDEWFPGERTRLVRLLKDRSYLRKGRSGSNTNTTPIRVKGEDVNCYTIKYHDIIVLVGDPRPVLNFLEFRVCWA